MGLYSFANLSVDNQEDLDRDNWEHYGSTELIKIVIG